MTLDWMDHTHFGVYRKRGVMLAHVCVIWLGLDHQPFSYTGGIFFLCRLSSYLASSDPFFLSA
jgi:hypothetical protein